MSKHPALQDAEFSFQRHEAQVRAYRERTREELMSGREQSEYFRRLKNEMKTIEQLSEEAGIPIGDLRAAMRKKLAIEDEDAEHSQADEDRD